MCLGIPGQIVEVLDEDRHLGKVDIGGVRRTVNIMLVVDKEEPLEDVIGSWVLVHVGFAMARIDPEEAQRTLEVLTEMGEVQAELEAMRQSPDKRSPNG